MGSEENTVGVITHVDTVPEGNGWGNNPFSCEIINGNLYGRGAVDDKGPLAACLYAMLAISKCGFFLKNKIRMIIGTDEESGWSDMKYYINDAEMPLIGFSPDAEFPIINEEKGILHVKASYKLENDIKININGGTMPNVVPSEAYVYIDKWDPINISDNDESLKVANHGNGWKIRAIGKAAHGSLPQEGINANIILLRTLLKGNFYDTRIYDALKALEIVSSPDGSKLSLATEIIENYNLTCNLGILSTKDDYINAIFDIRYPENVNSKDIIESFKSILCKYRWNIKIIDDKIPHFVSLNSLVIKNLSRAYEEVTGKKSYCITSGGGSFARLMKYGVAFEPIMPGDIDTTHSVNEQISVEKLFEASRIWARAMAYLACSNISKG